jgi:hypothetical protein
MDGVTARRAMHRRSHSHDTSGERLPGAIVDASGPFCLPLPTRSPAGHHLVSAPCAENGTTPVTFRPNLRTGLQTGMR